MSLYAGVLVMRGKVLSAIIPILTVFTKHIHMAAKSVCCDSFTSKLMFLFVCTKTCNIHLNYLFSFIITTIIMVLILVPAMVDKYRSAPGSSSSPSSSEVSLLFVILTTCHFYTKSSSTELIRAIPTSSS